MDPKTKTWPTQAEIADRLSVSRNTVSRALRGAGGISEETRERILRLAEQLGYRPNLMARGLKLQQTRTLGIVVPNLENPVFGRALRGSFEAAEELGYSTMICITGDRQDAQDRYLESLRARRIDGLVIAPVENDNRIVLDELRRDFVPLVLMERDLPEFEAHFVGHDNMLGSLEVMRHLLRLGRRRIGLLSGPPTHEPSRARRMGYFHGLAEAGLANGDRCIAEMPLLTAESGFQATLELLKREPGLDAIMAVNDSVAAGSLKALTKSGRKVPQDVALAGYGNHELSAFLSPPLTTIAREEQRLGEESVRLLVQVIERPGRSPFRVMLSSRLVVRESTAGDLISPA